MARESTALTLHASTDLSAAPSDFGDEHKRIVRDAFAPSASQAEFEMLWLGAKSRGLDPVRKQIHFVKRWDNQRNCDVWSSQVSIDGFRAIAQDTGLYDGQDEPAYEIDKDGRVLSVKVAVYRRDISRPFWGHARWTEFVQTNRGGGTSHMWSKMPFHMLAKCAEAVALRKGFPEKLAGLYVPEEMPQDDAPPSPRTVTLREVTTSAPALPAAETMTHVHVDGDALFEAAKPESLIGLLTAAREEGHGPAAEQAFAERVATLFSAADAAQYDELRAIASAAALTDGTIPKRTIGRAMKAADARIGTR